MHCGILKRAASLPTVSRDWEGRAQSCCAVYRNLTTSTGRPLRPGADEKNEMTIVREDFDVVRVSVMDEIAALVLMDQELRKMGPTFLEWENPDAPTFKIAKPVLTAAEIAAGALLSAIFGASGKLALQIAKARAEGLEELRKCLPKVEELVRLEIGIYSDTAAKGTNVRDKVLVPLNRLIAAWSEMSA